MGNKLNKKRKAIEYKPTNKVVEVKEQNTVARNILQQNVQGIPEDYEIKTALALQQSAKTGNLVKLDYIAILVRLNPKRDNLLLSQYKIKDLIALIRYELYNKPLENLIK